MCIYLVLFISLCSFVWADSMAEYKHSCTMYGIFQFNLLKINLLILLLFLLLLYLFIITYYLFHFIFLNFVFWSVFLHFVFDFLLTCLSFPASVGLDGLICCICMRRVCGDFMVEDLLWILQNVVLMMKFSLTTQGTLPFMKSLFVY